MYPYVSLCIHDQRLGPHSFGRSARATPKDSCEVELDIFLREVVFAAVADVWGYPLVI